jgi:hypothetical protein
VTARPILFSGPMIRALLDGRKTQTRRVVKPQPEIYSGYETMGDFSDPGWCLEWKEFEAMTPNELARHCPYGQHGDLLWVRESIVQSTGSAMDQSGEYTGHWGMGVKYVADGAKPGLDSVGNHFSSRPSIHMPRWASRLTLEITGVRVERLQDISEADAVAEGVSHSPGEGGRWSNGKVKFEYSNPLSAFIGLWCAINGQLAWKENPWVCVLEFRVHRQNVDSLLKSREAA